MDTSPTPTPAPAGLNLGERLPPLKLSAGRPTARAGRAADAIVASAVLGWKVYARPGRTDATCTAGAAILAPSPGAIRAAGMRGNGTHGRPNLGEGGEWLETERPATDLSLVPRWSEELGTAWSLVEVMRERTRVLAAGEPLRARWEANIRAVMAWAHCYGAAHVAAAIVRAVLDTHDGLEVTP